MDKNTEKPSLKLFVLIIFFLLPFQAAQAFDVDGIKSGMSQQRVKEIVTKWKYPNLVESRAHIHVDGGGQFYSFDFCDGKLTQMSKGIKPAMKTFIIMFNDLGKAYGKPIDSGADRLAADGGEHYVLDFLWRVDKEYVLLNYSVFPSNDSMHIYYHVPNRCFTYDSKYKKYFYSPK